MESSAKAAAQDSIYAFARSSAEAWEAVPEALIAFDTRGEIVFANSAAKDFLERRGLPLDAGSLRRVLKVCDPETQEPIATEQSPLARALRGEEIHCSDYLVCPAPQGTWFRVECGARPLYGKEAEIRGAVVVFRDITERKKPSREPAEDSTERKLWEETLRQSETRFTEFMRHLPGIAFIKDLSGKYVYYNDASWQQFGKRPEEIVGQTDEDIFTAEEAERHRAYDASVVANGRLVQFVEPVTHADGVHEWLIYKFPIMEDGNVALVGGIGIDITERRMLEDQLIQARKMEALGRLAGGVAHDFNNLLTVISGYGQLALESLNAPPERLASYIQEIVNSARRASGMTGQLLAFSRRQVVEPRVMDLADLLRNLEPLLRRMIGEHVELKMRCIRGRCLVLADEHQLEQMLMNLAGNARDAMPLGGSLEIECSVLEHARERPGFPPLGVMLEVRDNGVGMDETTKARMFEPFFTSKEKGRGTGLGLSTVYGVVSQAGGDIEVESEPGKGSRFRIYLPLAAGEAQQMPMEPPDATPVGLETVLLVEDEPAVRELAEAVLKKLGYKVFIAHGGEAALDIWDQHRSSIDVLLTDVIMPKMSGSELAHRLRQTSPRLKILFMSGYTDDMLNDHGVFGRETQLIQKPFTAEALARKLRSVLDA